MLVAAVLPRLVGRPAPSPAPRWGEAWGPDAVGADGVVATALDGRLGLAAGLLAVVAAQALFTALLLVLGERERRRPGLSVRWALGASSGRLVRHLLSRDGRRLGGLAVLGVAVGVALVSGVGWTWPGVPALEPQGVGWGRLAAVGALTVAVVTGTVALGVLAPLLGLARHVPATLRRGHGVTDDPRAGMVRRGLAMIQLAGAVAFASAGFGLIGEVPEPVDVAIDGSASADLTISRFVVGDSGRVSGPLLASPGAWIGVGVQDMVTVDCGECTVGVWYMPVYGVDTTVHAVGHGVLEAMGARVLEGRGIEAGDDAERPLVGVVNTAFRRHFQDGRPIGRQVRLRGGGDRWVEIVGVVDDPEAVGPGSPDTTDPVLWVALAQHPTSMVEGVAPGGSDPRLDPIGVPTTLGDLERAMIAPAVWSGWLLLFSGIVALALSLFSASAVGRIEARGRARATAIRLALGGAPGALARRLMWRTVRLSAGAAVAGVLVSWVLQAGLGVAGGSMVAAAARSTVAPWLALAVVVATAVGGWPRARALLRTQPGVLLRE